MKKTIKLFIIFIIILVILGLLYLFYNLLGTNNISLKEITSNEKEEILKIVNLNNIKDNVELEKLETPKTYKDIYYTLYFSINSENEDILNNIEIDNLYIDLSKIEESNNIVKYRCTISNMGKSIEVLEQIIDKYKR